MSAFVGIGTGRCGTMSLCRILRGCKNVYVTHEAFTTPWYSAGPNVGKFILAAKSGRHPNWPDSKGMVGEVSLNFLPHVQALRDPLPDLKVICLHRDKQETVNSFMRHLPGSPLRPSDRVVRSERYAGTLPANSIDRFPVIDAATTEQAWGFYWEMAEKMMEMVKPPVKHVWMKSLNDDFSLKSIYDFLEIDLTDRVFPDRRVWNSTQEVKERIGA